MGEGEVGRVTASAAEGRGTSVVTRKVGSGEFGRVITAGMEGAGTKITPLPNTGSGEFGSVITSGKEGAGVGIALLPIIGLGEFGNIITSGKEGIGRKKAAGTLSGTGEFGAVSSGGNEGAGRFGGSLAGFTKIGEVRGISFPRTGLEGNVSYDITLRSRDRTGNTGDLVPAGTVLTEDLLDVFGAEFVFKRNNTGVVPDPPISSELQRKTDNYIPTGWSDNPQGVSISNKYEYISSRTGSPGRWSEFGPPGLYDIFFVEGETEAQFIFRRTTSASAPNTPRSSTQQRASDSYIPSQWVRSAQGTTETLPYEWASYRLGSSKNWSVFYPPTLREAHPTARGPIPFFRAISGSSWSNSEATLATTGTNVTGDRVTLYNSTAKWTATRVWSGSRWITIGKWIDGNLIVEGSVLSIFDIIAGAAVQSSNYRAGVDGWRIAQDGDAEFNGTVFAESIKALDIQNVVVLKDGQSSISLTGSTSSIVLDQSVLGFTSIFFSFGYYTSPQRYWTGITFPVSKLVSGSSGSPPSGYNGFDITNPSNVASPGRISFWKSSSGRTLYFRENPQANAFGGTGSVRNIIGVRNPGSAAVPTPATPATPATQAPGTPSTPSVTARGQTSLTLSTTAGSGGAATGYRWRISTNSNVTNSDPIHTSTGPSITITGLTRDTDYWVDVRAENSVGNSAYSGNLATSTTASGVVSSGTAVVANAGSDVSVRSGGNVSIGGSDTITNPSGTTTYRWVRQSGTGGRLSSTTVASPTFTAPTVTSGRNIVWRKTTTNNGVSDTDDVTVAVTVSGAAGVSFDVSYTDSSVTKGV